MKYILSLIFAFVSTTLLAQNLPERGEVRKGNKAYEEKDYATAMEHYSKAMAVAPDNFEARFNLASSLIKGEKMEGADPLLKALAADSLQSVQNRSESYYNLGNSQFAQKKLQEALESYKNAIRLNPDDEEAKYNYSYVKSLLNQQQDQQQDQDQNEDQQDQNKQDQSQEKQQQQDQQNQDQQKEQEGEQDEQPAEPQQNDGEISDQEMQQMLDAIQAQEDKTQEEMERKKGQAVAVPKGKNW